MGVVGSAGTGRWRRRLSSRRPIMHQAAVEAVTCKAGFRRLVQRCRSGGACRPATMFTALSALSLASTRSRSHGSSVLPGCGCRVCPRSKRTQSGAGAPVGTRQRVPGRRRGTTAARCDVITGGASTSPPPGDPTARPSGSRHKADGRDARVSRHHAAVALRPPLPATAISRVCTSGATVHDLPSRSMHYFRGGERSPPVISSSSSTSASRRRRPTRQWGG